MNPTHEEFGSGARSRADAKSGAELAPIDRILAGEDRVEPSSGFLAAVMDRVREEAAAPPPIPFPWRRAVPGIALACGVLGWGGFELVRAAIPAARSLIAAPPQFPAAYLPALESVGWTTAALTVSFFAWILSRWLMEQSGPV